MPDLSNASPGPISAGAPAQGKNEQHQQTPTTRNQHNKRNHRQRKNHNAQVDGTVSDSVTNTMTTPHSKKAPMPRQHSVAVGALPQPNGSTTKMNSNKPRPVSMGGNMLPATPLKEQAYAGPTFQASPAPSSLPVPKFFSRSVPNVDQKSLEARMAGDKTPETEKSSPESDIAAPSPVPREAQRSPLDMFFKADRAEREKSWSASVRSHEMNANRPVPATEPRNAFQMSGKSVLLRELDEEENDRLSPKTVPHNNHQQLASSTSPTTQPNDLTNESDREAATNSLKDLLFNNATSSASLSTTTPSPQQRAHSHSRAPESPFYTPPSFQRSSSGPSTPTPNAAQQNNYSLHYGNKNLSPLFKAARGDTPPRPSGLRQQELANDLSPNGVSNHNQPPRHYSQPHPQIDPNSFSRNYLDQHIRSSQPASLPYLPLTNGINAPPQTSNNKYNRSPLNVPPNGVQAAGISSGSVSDSGASPRTGVGASQCDISSMEDDVRRMLNMKITSN